MFSARAAWSRGAAPAPAPARTSAAATAAPTTRRIGGEPTTLGPSGRPARLRRGAPRPSPRGRARPPVAREPPRRAPALERLARGLRALGAGSLVLVGRRWAVGVALFYAGLAVGVALAAPLHGSFAGSAIPAAQDHLRFLPARLLAILGNSLGSLAAIAVALATLRARPLGNALIVAGVAVAAAGSALGGLGVTGGAIAIAAGAVLLYGGFVARSSLAIRRTKSSTSSSEGSHAVIQRTI